MQYDDANLELLQHDHCKRLEYYSLVTPVTAILKDGVPTTVWFTEDSPTLTMCNRMHPFYNKPVAIDINKQKELDEVNKIAEEVSEACIAKVIFSEFFINTYGRIHKLKRLKDRL